jgi:polyhydroxyalkanoate synthesis regulator phasin
MATTNHSDSSLKKYFYSGIGFMAHSKDIVQKSVGEVVKQGRMSETEGKRIVDETFERWGNSYNDAIHSLGTWANGEILRLNARIVKMEKQLAMKQNAPANTTRTSARKNGRRPSTKMRAATTR